MRHELLRLECIHLDAYGQKILNDFNLVLYQGEILGVFSDHAVVKKNLVELIAGRKEARSGRLYLGTEPCSAEETDSRRHRQVGVVHSVSTLVDDLSIAENIFVIRQGVKAQVIDSRLINAQTQQLMDEFDLNLAPATLARSLSALDRCRLEIVKAVALGARIVVLHDFSSFLADAENGQLLLLAARLKTRGIGFLMVDSSPGHLSHGADRVIVVNKGRNFWSFGRGEFNDTVLRSCYSRAALLDLPDALVNAMTPATLPPEPAMALSFDCVRAGALGTLSFSLRQGEELCIFDHDGKGIADIRALLAGECAPAAGSIHIGAKPLTARNVWQALDQEIAFVVENPAETMLFPDFTALENLCLPASRKAPDFWLNPVYLKSCRQEYAQFFDVGVLDKYPDQLSAQDLHKLVYCRWHLYKPKLVVCVKPFSSVEKSLEDISAFFIDRLLAKGIAVLVLTSTASETGITCRKISLNPKNAPAHQKNDL